MAHKPKRNLPRLFFGKVPDDQIQWAYRIRVALFFALVVTTIAVLFLSYQFSQTIRQLYLVEDERDRKSRAERNREDPISFGIDPTLRFTTNGFANLMQALVS